MVCSECVRVWGHGICGQHMHSSTSNCTHSQLHQTHLCANPQEDARRLKAFPLWMRIWLYLYIFNHSGSTSCSWTEQCIWGQSVSLKHSQKSSPASPQSGFMKREWAPRNNSKFIMLLAKTLFLNPVFNPFTKKKTTHTLWNAAREQTLHCSWEKPRSYKYLSMQLFVKPEHPSVCEPLPPEADRKQNKSRCWNCAPAWPHLVHLLSVTAHTRHHTF